MSRAGGRASGSGNTKMGDPKYCETYEVTDEMLGYLVERAIVAHISPDSTHAYEKLQDAWATIRAMRIKKEV